MTLQRPSLRHQASGLLAWPIGACSPQYLDPQADSSCDEAGEPSCEVQGTTAPTFEQTTEPAFASARLANPAAALGTALGGLAPLAIGDIDGDGLLDVVIGDFSAQLRVFANDGRLAFHEADPVDVTPVPGVDGFTRAALALSLADRDGDGRPELWASGLGWLAVWPNLGGQFGEAELISGPSDDGAGLYTSFALGDIDGDEDLDIAVAPLGPLDSLEETLGSSRYPPVAVARVLYDDVGTWRPEILGNVNGQTVATMVRMSDYDGDGDLDFIVPGDRRYPLLLWENRGVDSEGSVAFVDVATAVGLYTTISGMALVESDLNGDGALDYAATDLGPPSLFLSSEYGYYEAAAALGLRPDREEGADPQAGWALRIADFNNDGWLDGFQASGAPVPVDADGCATLLDGQVACFRDQFDVLWQGNEAGFEEVTADAWLTSPHHHFSASPADFDEDGDLDLVVGGYDEPLHVYENVSAAGGWLDIELGGPSALGARVTVVAGDRSWVRETCNLSGPGQETPRLHFGLGALDSVDEIRIAWLGGRTTTLTDPPTRRVLSFVHDP